MYSLHETSKSKNISLKRGKQCSPVAELQNNSYIVGFDLSESTAQPLART